MRARAFNAGSVNWKMGDCGGVPVPPLPTAFGDMEDLNQEDYVIDIDIEQSSCHLRVVSMTIKKMGVKKLKYVEEKTEKCT